MFDFNDSVVRVSVFMSVFIICANLEVVFPKKRRTQARSTRWFSNISIIIIDSLLVRLIGQVSAVSVAFYATGQGWGLFNYLQLPVWLEITLSVVLLDLAIYLQHVASHKIPLLWRIHRVHHADRDIDVTTGMRFHPLEIILSMFYKCLIILLLGPSVLAVFLFEVILNASAMFNHSNLSLTLWLDNTLRKLVVTPDMHRIHHSVINRETNSNYGFFLSIWDKLFKTYNEQPEKGHDDMLIGLHQYQNEKPSHLLWCLKLPLTK